MSRLPELQELQELQELLELSATTLNFLQEKRTMLLLMKHGSYHTPDDLAAAFLPQKQTDT